MKYKAGDRVRVIKDGSRGSFHIYKLGEIITVTSVDNNGNINCESEKGLDNYVYEYEVELFAEPDMVNHPPHYTNKNPETIDMIRAVLTKEEFIGGLKWHILRYRDRAHDKGNLEQDMAKAKFYYDLLRKEQE